MHMVDSCIWLILICQFHVFHVNKHFGVTTKPEMTLEKLQIIAPTPVEDMFKAQWLVW